MSVRHLVIAALLVTAGAAQAQTARIHPGTLTGWAVTGVAGVAASSSTAAPGNAVQAPAPAVIPPVAATPGATAPEAAEVPEPSSIALLLAGAMGVGALRRRRAK